MRKPKLIEAFPDWLTGSAIFNALDTMDVPWKEDVAGSVLDLEYYGNISGNKTIAPLVRRMLYADGVRVLSAARIAQLAQMIYKMNISNWTREYATLFEEYNPISNYDMTETESSSKANTGTQADAHTGTETDAQTGTDTLDMDGTITSGHTGTQGVQESATGSGTTSSTTNNGIYGFNSNNASDSDTSTTSGTTSNQSSGSSTRTDALQDQDTYDRTDQRTLNTTDTKTYNDTRTRTDNLSETGSRTLTRSGNIGVTTSQQMIQSERDLYIWNFFYNVVFPCVDKVLALQTYNI